MKVIKFDLSCFKLDFQEYIFKNLGVNDYFEFINKYENNFSLNILNINNITSINEEESNSCTFKNINPSIIEDSSIINSEQIDLSINPNEEISRSISDNVGSNINKIISQIDSDDSYDEDEEKSDVKFTHYIENNQYYLTSSKKFISKKLSKSLKKNGGYWLRNKNLWIFPVSSKNYIENILGSELISSQIKNISHENNKVIVIPKMEHPKYGVSTIYDKTGNLGIWDNSIKGWVFSKNSNK